MNYKNGRGGSYLHLQSRLLLDVENWATEVAACNFVCMQSHGQQGSWGHDNSIEKIKNGYGNEL